MKITELTKEQRERIEKYEVGIEHYHLLRTYDKESFWDKSKLIAIRNEIKRTIKRIEDEIEFLENLICVEFQFSINSENHKSFQHPEQRLEKLKQELEDYKLMEKLE